MHLIVLHYNGSQHESTLDEDVKNMGTRYGNVTHVLYTERKNYQFPNPNEESVFHILAHGAADHVSNMPAKEFNVWMVKAFSMSSNKGLAQTYFIYSCDVAKEKPNLLSGLADHVAGAQIKERRFIGTIGENGVVNTSKGKGQILLKTPGGKLQSLGQGWRGYRTFYDKKAVVSRSISGPDVQKAVVDFMNWA